MMKDRTENIIFGLVMIGFIIFSFGSLAQHAFSQRHVTIQGEVIDADFSNDNYMIVTFDNGETYHISYYSGLGDIDLTVNSTMAIRLRYNSTWFAPNTDEIWGITSIVKVPENLSEV